MDRKSSRGCSLTAVGDVAQRARKKGMAGNRSGASVYRGKSPSNEIAARARIEGESVVKMFGTRGVEVDGDT